MFRILRSGGAACFPRMVLPFAERLASGEKREYREGWPRAVSLSRVLRADAQAWLALSEPPAGSRFLTHRHEPACFAQPARRRVSVRCLVLPGLDEVRLVPDPGSVAASDPPPVVAPHLEVRIVLVLGERLEVLKRSLVLNDRGDSQLVREQPLVRMRDEVVEHVRHPSPPAEIGKAPQETRTP